MGEQTQKQIETETQTPSSSDSTVVSDPPVDIPSNPSKIPIRPQKIRKISSTTDQTTLQPSDSSHSVVTSKSTGTITKNRRRGASKSTRAFPQIIKSSSAYGEIENALHHLRIADPLLGSLIDTLPFPAFESHQLPFLALCKSILYQQLACKAGSSIYTRFVSLCGGEDVVCPDVVLSLSAQQLTQIGVSVEKQVTFMTLRASIKLEFCPMTLL